MASDFISYRRRAERMKKLEELYELCVSLCTAQNALNPTRARILLDQILTKVQEIKALPAPHLTSL